MPVPPLDGASAITLLLPEQAGAARAPGAAPARVRDGRTVRGLVRLRPDRPAGLRHPGAGWCTRTVGSSASRIAARRHPLRLRSCERMRGPWAGGTSCLDRSSLRPSRPSGISATQPRSKRMRVRCELSVDEAGDRPTHRGRAVPPRAAAARRASHARSMMTASRPSVVELAGMARRATANRRTAVDCAHSVATAASPGTSRHAARAERTDIESRDACAGSRAYKLIPSEATYHERVDSLRAASPARRRCERRQARALVARSAVGDQLHGRARDATARASAVRRRSPRRASELARSSQLPCTRPSGRAGRRARARRALHEQLADDRRAREPRAAAAVRVVLEHGRAHALGRERARARIAIGALELATTICTSRRSSALEQRARGPARAPRSRRPAALRLLGEAEADQVGRDHARVRGARAARRPRTRATSSPFPCRHSTTGPAPSST